MVKGGAFGAKIICRCTVSVVHEHWTMPKCIKQNAAPWLIVIEARTAMRVKKYVVGVVIILLGHLDKRNI